MSSRWVSALLTALLLTSCAAGPRRPVEVAAPPLEPPPPAGGPLAKEEALALAHRVDPDAAIAELDRRPFAFALDDPTLAWFEAQQLPGPVLDYLAKRARVDWEALRTGPDSSAPR